MRVIPRCLGPTTLYMVDLLFGSSKGYMMCYYTILLLFLHINPGDHREDDLREIGVMIHSVLDWIHLALIVISVLHAVISYILRPAAACNDDPDAFASYKSMRAVIERKVQLRMGAARGIETTENLGDILRLSSLANLTDTNKHIGERSAG
jgi:hypothetical protein